MCHAASLLLIRYNITGWSTRRGLEPWQKTVRSFASQFLPIRSVPPSGITSGDVEFSQIPRRAIHWCLDDGPASWSMEVGTLKIRLPRNRVRYVSYVHVPLLLAREYLSEVPPAIRAGTTSYYDQGTQGGSPRIFAGQCSTHLEARSGQSLYRAVRVRCLGRGGV